MMIFQDGDRRRDHRGDEHEKEQDGHGHEPSTMRIMIASVNRRNRRSRRTGYDRGRDDAGEQADDDRGLAALHEASELGDHIRASMLGR